ncbi:NUDIX hydrolase [Candidatus Pacearchaeota archaeon]|nr:NUDIX hydrolase [Candidatus Pacearchaeota archaeon]
MAKIRRRGVAIVEFKKGILIVSTNGKKFMLPGGGAKMFESRRRAAIRELYEETGLKIKSIKYLFSYVGKKWRNHKSKLVKNYTKVFVVKSVGNPKPKSEIRHIKFWTPKSKINLTSGTRIAVKKYLDEE